MPTRLFTQYLTNLNNQERSGAVDSLHGYFDYATIHHLRQRILSEIPNNTNNNTNNNNNTTTNNDNLPNHPNNNNNNNNNINHSNKSSNLMPYASILLAATYASHGDHETARLAAREGAETARQCGDGHALSYALAWLGLLEHKQLDYQHSHYYDESSQHSNNDPHDHNNNNYNNHHHHQPLHNELRLLRAHHSAAQQGAMGLSSGAALLQALYIITRSGGGNSYPPNTSSQTDPDHSNNCNDSLYYSNRWGQAWEMVAASSVSQSAITGDAINSGGTMGSHGGQLFMNNIGRDNMNMSYLGGGGAGGAGGGNGSKQYMHDAPSGIHGDHDDHVRVEMTRNLASSAIWAASGHPAFSTSYAKLALLGNQSHTNDINNDKRNEDTINSSRENSFDSDMTSFCFVQIALGELYGCKKNNDVLDENRASASSDNDAVNLTNLCQKLDLLDERVEITTSNSQNGMPVAKENETNQEHYFHVMSPYKANVAYLRALSVLNSARFQNKNKTILTSTATSRYFLEKTLLLHEWAIRRCNFDLADSFTVLLDTMTPALISDNSDSGLEIAIRVSYSKILLHSQRKDYHKAFALLKDLTYVCKLQNFSIYVAKCLTLNSLMKLECNPNYPTMAIEPLIECLDLTNRESMDSAHATAESILAKAFVEMKDAGRARALLQSCFPTLLLHGHVWFRGEAYLTSAKCFLLEADDEECRIRKSKPMKDNDVDLHHQETELDSEIKNSAKIQLFLREAAERLEMAECEFGRVQDAKRLQEIYYLTARISDTLEMKTKRDIASNMFIDIGKYLQFCRQQNELNDVLSCIEKGELFPKRSTPTSSHPS